MILLSWEGSEKSLNLPEYKLRLLLFDVYSYIIATLYMLYNLFKHRYEVYVLLIPMDEAFYNCFNNGFVNV